MSNGNKASILLVEDEENLHEALKLNLELEGYEVTSAFDGSEALKAVQEEYFDLIILDIMLPEIDGIAVIETIRVQNNRSTGSDSQCKKHQLRPGAGIKKRSR